MTEISKTVDHALLVLEAISEHGPITTAELVHTLGMHRSILNRLISTLHLRGYIRRSARGYVLGVAVLRIAQRVEAELLEVARPVLVQLADRHGETFILTAIDGQQAVQLEQATGKENLLRIDLTRGFRHSLARGANGRAILAFLDDSARERIVATVDNPAALRKQLDEVKMLGYAISHDELASDVHGVSVPIHAQDQVLGSLGVVVPSARMQRLETLVPIVKMAAREVGLGLAVARDGSGEPSYHVRKPTGASGPEESAVRIAPRTRSTSPTS